MRCAISEKPDAEEEFSSVWAGVSSDEAGMRSAKLNWSVFVFADVYVQPFQPHGADFYALFEKGFQSDFNHRFIGFDEGAVVKRRRFGYGKIVQRYADEVQRYVVNVTSRLSVCWAYCCAMAFSFSAREHDAQRNHRRDQQYDGQNRQYQNDFQ